MTYLDAADLAQYSGGLTASAARSELSRLSKSARRDYDIFLSHSFLDVLLVYGLKGLLEDEGFSVYIDWLEDPHLSRDNVTTATAERLRTRMNGCRTFVYATSRNASTSRWMPWELGYFDGRRGPERVATCPIDAGTGTNYVGEEYLGLYKGLEKIRDSSGRMRPYVVRQLGEQAETLRSFVSGRGAYVGLTTS